MHEMAVATQTIKNYKSEAAMKHDVAHMARNGWQVQSMQTGAYRKAGLLSWLLWGPLNFLRKSKAREITVVYSR
jgi:hypothetical protein